MANAVSGNSQQSRILKLNFSDLNLRLLAIVSATVLSGCGNYVGRVESVPVKQANTATANEQKLKPPHLEYGNLWMQKKSEYVIIPVGYKVASKTSYASDYSASKSSILRGQDLSAVNLIFHHERDDRTHLLLERNAFITQFDYLADTNIVADKITPSTRLSSCKPPANTAADHIFRQLMVYKIVEQDTNQNRALDLQDANKGYLSDLTGKNLRSLTPDLTKLAQWHCDYQRNRLLLFVRELNPQFQKPESPLALYIYDLPTSKLTRITLPKSNLENWQIDLNKGLIYLYSRLDGNGDRQYDSQDETRVIKYNLDTQQTIEVNNLQIRESLSKQ